MVQSTSAAEIEEASFSILAEAYTWRAPSDRIIRKSQALACLRSAYWYLVEDQKPKAAALLKKAYRNFASISLHPYFLALALLLYVPLRSRLFLLKTIYGRL